MNLTARMRTAQIVTGFTHFGGLPHASPLTLVYQANHTSRASF